MCDCRARWDPSIWSSFSPQPSSGWHLATAHSFGHRRIHLSVKKQVQMYNLDVCSCCLDNIFATQLSHFLFRRLVPTNCSCLGETDDQQLPDTLFKDRSLPQGLPLHQHSMTIGHAHTCSVLQISNGLSRVLHAVSSSASLPCRPHGGKLGPSAACAASQSIESTTNRCHIDVSATSSVMPPQPHFVPSQRRSRSPANSLQHRPLTTAPIVRPKARRNLQHPHCGTWFSYERLILGSCPLAVCCTNFQCACHSSSSILTITSRC